MLLVIDTIDISTQTFECTRYWVPLDLCSLLRKVSLECLPSMHPLHTPCCPILYSESPITISLKIGNALWCRFPILLLYNFHKQSLLCTKDQTSSPCNLYKLPSLTPITWVVPRPESFNLMKTCWFLNSTTNPLSSLLKLKANSSWN